jgi:DnaJ-class molecular chaperone
MSEAVDDGGRETCTPCGGSGKVISGLGGERHEVSCPWCGGSGRFMPGIDAQQQGRPDVAPDPD